MLYDKFGVTLCDTERATPGYTLFSPLWQSMTYIINMEGEIVHQWNWKGRANAYGRLLPEGDLLWGEAHDADYKGHVKTGIRQVDWEGNILWSYFDTTQHHDFRRLKNGNFIYIGLEELPDDAARRVQGGLLGSELDGGKIKSDYLREVTPEGETVWEWHTHVDFDIEKYVVCPLCPRGDYLHINSIAETVEGGIMISCRHINLIAVIDKMTNKFKWEYQNLDFGHQHDFHQLENGNYMVFANGAHTTRSNALGGSQVIEINPKNKEHVWTYKGSPPHTFNSRHISGAQRLATGNTLICEGISGRIFEVTPEGDVVWNYISPYFSSAEIEGPAGNQNMVFRALRYDANSPEISGRLNPDAYKK
tara:strand:+ start:284 stop:1372 length:1089 start_codon:yes stop_codon:yes gene_type:complete